MIFFSVEQVKRIHSDLLEKTGGAGGIRDEALLDSALKSPFQTFAQQDLYPEIRDKAAQLCYSLIENHPFVDGNKRTGIHLFLLFLRLNQTALHYTQEEIVDLGFGIASGEIDVGKIKDWISAHKK